jgi:hypothetical protein
LQKRKESIFQLNCYPKQAPRYARERRERLSVEFNRTSISVEDAEQLLWELK